MPIEKVFISYAHADSELSAQVCDLLDDYGIEYWKDKKGLPPAAEDFNEIIEKAIDECSYFVCVCSVHIKDSIYCKKELERACEWKSRQPNKRAIFILKMNSELDDLTCLPSGCNLQFTGDNFLYAYEPERLNESINQIADYIFKNVTISGISPEEFKQKMQRKNEFDVHIDADDSYIDLILNDDEKQCVNSEKLELKLISGNNIFIRGDRGAGKTHICNIIYNDLWNNMIIDINDESEIIYVPIKVELEVLWKWNHVLSNNVLSQLCRTCNVPYCIDERIKYIVILDGEMRTSSGYLPESVDKMIDEKSKIHSLLITQTDIQFLSGFDEYEIQPLRYGSIVKYIVKQLEEPNVISDFFNQLLYKAFLGTTYQKMGSNTYFNIIKKIYGYFKTDGDNIDRTIQIDDFYSINLANTTQKGRLPKSLIDDDEINVWKKLIRCNEVFSAIRNPFYLNWLIKIYNYKEFTFPLRLKTLQMEICQLSIDEINVSENLKCKIVDDFLIPLSNFLFEKNGKNQPASLSEFKAKLNNTNFERVKRLLVEKRIINIANNDIVFFYDFMFDYFMECNNASESKQLERAIRTCRMSELLELFMRHAKYSSQESDNQKDLFEVAVDTILDERASFRITSSEKNSLIEILQDKITQCDSFYYKASIYNGIGKYFNDLTLCGSNEDFFVVKNSFFWHEISSGVFISKFPITCYYFSKFVEDGYENPKYWKYGLEMLRRSDGTLRKRPLQVDDDIKKVFDIPNHPIVGVSWYEAQAFCQWLNEKLGVNYCVNLPTCVDVYDLALKAISQPCNSKNSFKFESTTPVMTFFNDSVDVCDIVGNVWEWSSDAKDYFGETMVDCYGGCWSSETDIDHLFSAYPARLSSNNIGFRVVIQKNI